MKIKTAKLKYFLMMFIYSSMVFSLEDRFVIEASNLASDLKESLMQNLSEKISQHGVVEAVPFCHANVISIAKGAAKDRIEKYKFGRTSNKVRNSANKPEPWVINYLKEFEGKKKGEIKKDYIVHKSKNGTRVYVEPLYVEAKCLMCHGEKVSQKVSDKIKELYPDDKATGFKLGEFRGFMWIKENHK